MMNGCAKRWHQRKGDKDLNSQVERVFDRERLRLKKDEVVHEDHRTTLLKLRAGDIQRANKISRILNVQRKELKKYVKESKNMTLFGVRSKQV